MKYVKPVNPFTPHELQRFIFYITLGSLFLLSSMVIDQIFTEQRAGIIIFGLGGIVHLVLANILFANQIIQKKTAGVINALITGIGLGALSLILPEYLNEVRHILVIFQIITITLLSGPQVGFASLLFIIGISLPAKLYTFTNIESTLDYAMPFIVALALMDVVRSIKTTTRQHIHKLETINKVSRQIMRSLDTRQILSLLDQTIRDTLVADTHFIGFQEGEKINLELFYDDGEYFNGTQVPLKGTLTGWVLKNQKEIFLPDLRENIHLDGVEIRMAGKDKTSLSWIGIPLKTDNLTGILALASYTANAFDRADVELLVSLGQYVTQALDNSIQHAKVEKQTRLDSMTGVYNHGYFLKQLEEVADQSLKTGESFSLIMLDVDHFKHYNDTYGHLVGDYVLTSLCKSIQNHIKQTDAVGRWGGEEFIISLPGATAEQAVQIAKRISHTLSMVHIQTDGEKTIPIPTISQGIAVFPQEANDIYKLIDLADKRLYVAKERGRDQIEPDERHWNK